MTETNRPTHDEYEGGVLEAITVWKLRWMRPVFAVVCAVLGGATALSAAIIGGLAYRSGEYMVALFEVLAIVAGVFATLVSIGKFREGAGIALASCALAIGGAAILSEPALVSRFFSTRVDPVVVGGVEIKWIMVGRIGVAVALMIGAGVVVWSRRPRASAWFLVRASLLSVPLVLVAAAFVVPAVHAWIDGLPAMVRVVAVVAGFFIGLALASAAGHCFIRSLEMGRLDDAGDVHPDTPEFPRAAA